MSNSQNSRWWFACDQCNAMCKTVSGILPPPHSHDQRFHNQLAAEFPEGFPEPATVDITSDQDYRLGDVPMFVDGVNVTAALAEQVRRERLDRLEAMTSRDEYVAQAAEMHARQNAVMHAASSSRADALHSLYERNREQIRADHAQRRASAIAARYSTRSGAL